MINGPLHTYGHAPAAGVELSIAVPKFARPGELRTVAIKRGIADALTISLVANFAGWGPFTFILATGVTALEWNTTVNFALPIGTELTLTTSGLGGADVVQGAVVVEEMRM
ncbi:unnamed protein product [marine sediment metagenome]|uniref:Uncharacterized protein n=1 Tax=marine sediment metagenome TaxID=412755 RepID=X0U712_9ZZZZ